MITLEAARRVVSAAEEKAREIGQPMDIAVLDGGRNLKSFAGWTTPGSGASRSL